MAFDNSVSRAEESRFRFMVIASLEFELVKKELESAGDGGKNKAVHNRMAKELYALDRGVPLSAETISKYGCRRDEGSHTKQLPPLRRSRVKVSKHASVDADLYADDHFYEICDRALRLKDTACAESPYRWFSVMVRSVLEAKTRAWKKDAPSTVSGEALSALESEREGKAEYDLRRVVSSLVYLSGDPRRQSWPIGPVAPRRHVAELPRAEEGRLLEALSPDESPLLLVFGEAGTGRNTLIDEVVRGWVARGRVSGVFDCAYSVSIEATIASAVAGGWIDADEEGCREALKSLPRAGERYVLVLRDVPGEKEKELESWAPEIPRPDVALAVSFLGEETSPSREKPPTSAVQVVNIAAPDKKALMPLAEKCIGAAGCGGADGDDAAGEIIERAGGNIKLVEVASLVAGYSGKKPVLEALGKSGDAAKRLGEVVLAHPDADAALALCLLSFFPPVPIPIPLLRGGLFPSPLTVAHLVDYRLARIVSRDGRGTASFALDGALVRAAAAKLRERLVEEEREGFSRSLREFLDHLWERGRAACRKRELDAAISYYENVAGFFAEGGDLPCEKEELDKRLAVLYRLAGRTWDELRLRERMLEGHEGTKRMEALLELGRLKTSYGERGDALGDLDKGLALGGQELEELRQKLENGENPGQEGRDALLVLAKLYRQKGWTLPEVWKRDPESEKALGLAIEAKREAVGLFEGLSGLCSGEVKPVELQKAYSTLAYSLVESVDGSEEAVERAWQGIEKLERGYEIKVSYDPNDGLVRCERPSERPSEELRELDLAEALYFYGRVLAGGERPTHADGNPNVERTLREALAYEQAAFKKREENLGEQAKTSMVIAYNHDSLALVHEALGEREEAKKHSDAAYRIHGMRFHYLFADGSRIPSANRPKNDPLVANYDRIMKL